MARQSRPRLTATTGILAGIAVTAVLGLAACGSAVAGGPAHSGTNNAAKKFAIQPGGVMIPAGKSTGTAVCMHIPSLVKVTFVRTPSMVSGTRIPQPSPVMVKDPAAVRRLAKLLCGLPGDVGLMNCPADFGTGYRLVFATAQQGFSLVTVHTSGCRTVSGLGQARSWARSPQLGQVVRRTVDSGSALLPGHHASVPTS
jgi:hypothetical protein